MKEMNWQAYIEETFGAEGEALFAKYPGFRVFRHGSNRKWFAVIIFACYPVIIAMRLKDEEDLLTRELPGYEAYKRKVRYRLIPYIW